MQRRRGVSGVALLGRGLGRCQLALAQHGWRAVARAERDRAPAAELEAVDTEPEVVARERRAQDELHLQEREAGAETAAPPAAERYPRIRPRRLVEEPLGPEG